MGEVSCSTPTRPTSLFRQNSVLSQGGQNLKPNASLTPPSLSISDARDPAPSRAWWRSTRRPWQRRMAAHREEPPKGERANQATNDRTKKLKQRRAAVEIARHGEVGRLAAVAEGETSSLETAIIQFVLHYPSEA